MRLCTVCGVPVEGDARFCSACGADIGKVQLEGYCPTCHQVRRSGGDGACGSCRTPLVDVHAVASAASGGSLPPPVPVVPVVATLSTMPGKPAGHRNTILRLAVAGVAVAGLVVFGVMQLTGRDDGASTTDATTPATSPATTGGTPGTTDGTPGGTTATTAAGTVPATTPATASGGGDGLVVLSSNAYMEQGGLSIDGEDRTLYFVAEVRNDSGAKVEVDEVTITVSDAAGNVIATRRDHLIDDVLDVGESGYLYEFTPSMMYQSDETNTYPEGWASWNLDFTTDSYNPSDYEEVNLTIQDLVVTPSGTPVHATGTIVNATNRTVSGYSIEVYVALYDATGALVNIGWTFADAPATDMLAPGGTTTFRVDVPFGPAEYATTVVGAVGMTEP